MIGLMEAGLDEFAEGGEGLIGIGSVGFQVQFGTAASRQGYQVEDALAIDCLTVEMDPDFRSKTPGQPDWFLPHRAIRPWAAH